MPKKEARKSGKGRKGGRHGRAELGTNLDRSIVVKGVYRGTLSAAVQVSGVLFNPLNFEQRLVDLSDNYQEFRFKRVKVRLYNGNVAQELQLAYTPVILTATPTLGQLSTLACYNAGNGQFGSPNPTLTIGQREMGANAPKWFRRGTTYDDLLEYQGILYFGQSVTFSTTNATFIIEYEIQLKARAEAGLTSALYTRQSSLEEKVAELSHVVGCIDRRQVPRLPADSDVPAPDPGAGQAFQSPTPSARQPGAAPIAQAQSRGWITV